jgi:putative ABC transport system ATP-binding protein
MNSQTSPVAVSTPFLEARGLVKSYEEGNIQALRGVDVKIDTGEYVAISGASGSGKSTLLHLLGGLDKPTQGQVFFKGSELGKAVDLDTYRSHQVGFIFQAFYLLPTLRAVENVQVPCCRCMKGPMTAPNAPLRCSKRWGLRHACAIFPASSLRASGNAWPSRAHWPTIPPSCSPTNPPATSTA